MEGQMGRRRTLTDEGVGNLKPRAKRYAFPDPEMPSHYIRVTPVGAKSFCVVVRDRDGKQRWITTGPYPAYNIGQARKRAGEIIRSIREGRDQPDSFAAVAANWRKLHCEARGLRSIRAIDRFISHMTRAWAGRDFASIGRGDVAKLMDKVEHENGTRQANYILQTFSSMANWYAAREDTYRSPIVKGMRRGTPPKRDRILSDDELREVWRLAESNGKYGAIIRLALLTGQRREKIGSMKWDDLDGDVWTIATEAREKGNAGKLVLPDLAMDIINAQERHVSNPYVFPGKTERSHFCWWSEAKATLDAKLPPMPHWTIHDLRRTARSLMSRAGIRPDISERVLGHVIAGVEGIYDRHQYREEKAQALRALAGLLENILRPHGANVRRLRG
jgi:integrase